ncbi:MAG: DUF4091 domain-containing protein [Clostridia bacterium]|nr:DUF4091 domain-containing protein [Clostridia bacterium]
MKLIFSSSLTKIFSEEDCYPIDKGQCLTNESFAFQVYVQAEEGVCAPVSVEADVPVNVYEVKKMKGDYYGFYGERTPDDYDCRVEDNEYPELLKKTDQLCLEAGESATLFIEIPAEKKAAGVHKITVKIGAEEKTLPLTVLPVELEETNLIITHWFHMDGIADYYHVKPFSEAFYARFEQFLKAYLKMGNTVVFVPLFTPPLDTHVGCERTTAQLIGVEKNGEEYTFDFSEMERYVKLCLSCGAKYFEFSHLFTQWGGEFCPKIIVKENGVKRNLFGWNVSSEAPCYQAFLKQFFKGLLLEMDKLGIKDKSFLHLTDEPGEPHIERYERLSKFVKENCPNIPVMDALSHYDFAANGSVDMPVVAMNSKDLEKFNDREHMLYYCQSVDEEYLSNRYFHMPLQRTAILGYQLYQTQVKGFLHWGYNFYNAAVSKRKINPYEVTTADAGLPAGDCFVVYPGDEEVEYSIRYFALLKGFEEERLMETLEKKIGKKKALKMLENEGVSGVHKYPRSVSWHETFRQKIYAELVK